ncbi:MAG TPA: sterol desaturase family protein [Pyrinomonadaceae bacterium]|jgi:sterol desaturase/sphingolipid hydroxylase (fatty acid hydroxylase superfamily)
MKHEERRERGGKVPAWLSGALVLGAFAALAWLERRRPLRGGAVEAKWRREARNLCVAGAGALALQLVETPVVAPLARLVERRGWGLCKRLRLPAPLEVLLACVLLDYTLYLWHVLTHRVPLLWRFHVVHHADLELDASTAVRFHFGELALSVPWRAAQVLLLGVGPRALSTWQTLLLISILFHHSNVRLPFAVERRLNRLLVTPRMHGIHHSVIRAETNANWSSGLTVWDWLHGTLRLDVPQTAIEIGVPAYRDPADLTLDQILAQPFAPQRPTWQLPDGREPLRAALPAARRHIQPSASTA